MPVVMSLEDLAEGMVTAEPVLNHLGQLLLGQGLTLSARHLRVLKTWGIEKCLIKGGAEAVEPEISEAGRTRAWEQVQERLLWEPRNVWEKELVHIAVHQTLCRYGRNREFK
ncbi:MAG TPA: hypothetical protein VK564_04310 [Thermodesulfobacteriota bacterium]|nr:hypothetical protein [Thermodesulfobacteriota bacterium]